VRSGFAATNEYNPLGLISGEAGHVPDAPALETSEKSRHPEIKAISYGTTGRSHCPVYLPIPLQFLEEDGHKLSYCAD